MMKTVINNRDKIVRLYNNGYFEDFVEYVKANGVLIYVPPYSHFSLTTPIIKTECT